MSDLTYESYNKKSLLVHGDREKYGTKLKEVGGRWNNRVKGEPGWTVPAERESELKKLIAALKKEETIENMRSHAKPVREQKKYHRAVSESESENENSDSEGSEKSDRENEKESCRPRPASNPDEPGEKIEPKGLRDRFVSENVREISRTERSRPAYSSESEEDDPPSRMIKPIREENGRDKHDRRRGNEYARDEREKADRMLQRRPKSPGRDRHRRHPEPEYSSGRHAPRDKSPDRGYVRRKEAGRNGFERSPRRRKSPSLTSESESVYSSSEDDLPAPHSPVKRKTREDLERDMRRKIKDLQRQVEEMRHQKRNHRR